MLAKLNIFILFHEVCYQWVDHQGCITLEVCAVKLAKGLKAPGIDKSVRFIGTQYK